MKTPGEIAAQLNKLVFSILLIGTRTADPSRKPSLRKIRHHSFQLIVRGRGTVTLNGASFPAEPGTLFFLSPGMTIERSTDPDHPLEYYFLRFHYTETYEEKEQWISRSSEDCPFPFQGVYHVHNTLQLIYLFEKLFIQGKRRGHLTALRRKILLLEFFLAVLHDLRVQKIAGNTSAAIKMTQDYMVQHYQESMTLDRLAGMAGLSVSHYSRLFRKMTGYSPIDYLTHLRMDRAKELLALSDYRLKTVATSVGYSDEFYFSRMFKKVVGVSPREYVKRHKGSGSRFTNGSI